MIFHYRPVCLLVLNKRVTKKINDYEKSLDIGRRIDC